MRFPFRHRRGSLAGATWIGDRLLLLLSDELRGGDLSATGPVELDVSATSFVCPDSNRDESRTALLIRLLDPAPKQGLSLEVRAGGRTTRISEAKLIRANTDVRTLLRRHLARVGTAERPRLLSMLAEGAQAELLRAPSLSLARNLNLIRNALRVPLETRVRTMHDRQAVQVERVLGIDERSFWVRGWASDRATADPNVVLVSPEGHRVPVTDGAHRHARPDVDQFFAGARSVAPGIESGAKHGFVKYVEVPSPSVLASGWIAELRDPDLLGVEIEAPPVEKDVASVRRGIMTDLEHFASLTPDDEFLLRHAHPALSKLQERIRQDTRVDTVKQFGEPSESPDISVIVPLYGRIDFIEHQLCQFMHDPGFRELDLIYVLDSPELGEQLSKSAAALHALYELPFRTVTLNRNAGYSIANNLGASLARGRLLLLLNSDVVPDLPGWTRELTRFYDATPAIGALGPKLLYEDGSLQHAGLYFDRQAGAPLWTNLHYFKGLRSDFPPANIARPVPAVTGACLMIARSIWEELGGLRPDFVQGGYEDSDLCLRLLEAGHDNWYLPHVELHHLEDQSFPSGARRMATAYNTWLQTFMRGEQIERLMGEERFSVQPDPYLLNSS